MDQTQVSINDIVQINPDSQLGDRQGFFAGCLMVVTEIRSWGVQGYISVPDGPRGTMPKSAYYRAPWGSFARVGHAEWIIDRGDDQEASQGQLGLFETEQETSTPPPPEKL